MTEDNPQIVDIRATQEGVRLFLHIDQVYTSLDHERNYVSLTLNPVTVETIAKTAVEGTSQEETIKTLAEQLWLARREEEDKCDIEFHELGTKHDVWRDARLAYNVLVNGRP